MNYIFEGANSVGKTTIINKIKSKLNDYDYVHLDSTTPNDYKYHEELLQKDNTLIDRFFLGEIIYSVIFNRNPKLNLSNIETLLSENPDNTLFILYCDEEVIKERLLKRNRYDDGRLINNFNKEIILANDLFQSLGKYLSDKYENVYLINTSNLKDIDNETLKELLDL